jgi:trinucleotide repeat-containing gene 6 protein
VPEFEPGKPWKGNNLKNIEDDPSLTPGSVMPSAMSMPVIKDSVFSSNKTSPPASIVASASDTISSVGLSNPTWSYNSASSGSAFAR